MPRRQPKREVQYLAGNTTAGKKCQAWSGRTVAEVLRSSELTQAEYVEKGRSTDII